MVDINSQNTDPNTTPNRPTRPNEKTPSPNMESPFASKFETPKKVGKTLTENFKLGDKVYGLSAERENYFTSAFNHKFNLERDPTIDQLNNELRSPASLNNLTEESEQYKRYLIKSKYRDKVLLTKSDEQFNRSSCKAALFNPAIPTIHFILDEIDVERVLTKQVKSGRGEYVKDRSFTNSELRCMARNWDQLKDRVKFYQYGYEIPAPDWITSQEKRDALITLYQTRQKRTPGEKELADKRADRISSEDDDSPRISPDLIRFNLGRYASIFAPSNAARKIRHGEIPFNPDDEDCLNPLNTGGYNEVTL